MIGGHHTHACVQLYVVWHHSSCLYFSRRASLKTAFLIPARVRPPAEQSTRDVVRAHLQVDFGRLAVCIALQNFADQRWYIHSCITLPCSCNFPGLLRYFRCAQCQLVIRVLATTLQCQHHGPRMAWQLHQRCRRLVLKTPQTPRRTFEGRCSSHALCACHLSCSLRGRQNS